MKRILKAVIGTVALLAITLSLFSCAYECRTCRDRLTVECNSCDGEKEKTCQSCGGDGVASCGFCMGTGRRMCASCGGAGGRYEYDFFSKTYTYRMCCGSGYTFCPTTATCGCGDGRVSCTLCDENGRIACPDCSAK